MLIYATLGFWMQLTPVDHLRRWFYLRLRPHLRHLRLYRPVPIPTFHHLSTLMSMTSTLEEVEKAEVRWRSSVHLHLPLHRKEDLPPLPHASHIHHQNDLSKAT